MLAAIILTVGLVAVYTIIASVIYAIAGDTGQNPRKPLKRDELKAIHHSRLRWYF